MRLKSSIWVAAYLRRCQTEGIFGAVRRRGAEEAGAVFVKVALLDGNAMLYVPAPQTVYDDSRPIERFFMPTSPQPVPEASVEERLAKEIRFDPGCLDRRDRGPGRAALSRSGAGVDASPTARDAYSEPVRGRRRSRAAPPPGALCADAARARWRSSS